MIPKIEAIVAPALIKKALEDDRKYDVFHPSAWGSCLRKVAYQYYNELHKFKVKMPRDIDLRTQRVFDNGHKAHHRWQEYLDLSGVLRGHWKCQNPNCGQIYGKDEKIGVFNPLRQPGGFRCKCGNTKNLSYEEILVESKEHNFYGHVDAIMDLSRNERWKAAEGPYVVDFKTIKDEMFSELEQAKYEHIIQVHIYMWLLELKAGIVLYEDKDNQALKEMFVPRDERIVDKIKQDATWMIGILSRNKLPPRMAGASRSKFPCRLCEFASICWE